MSYWRTTVKVTWLPKAFSNDIEPYIPRNYTAIDFQTKVKYCHSEGYCNTKIIVSCVITDLRFSTFAIVTKDINLKQNPFITYLLKEWIPIELCYYDTTVKSDLSTAKLQ